MPEFSDKPLRERTAAFIDLANSYVPKNAPPEMISASLMEASSRFHAWVWALNTPTPEDMQRRRQEAIDHFTRESRKMFEANYDDYVRNHTAYTAGQRVEK